MNGYLEILLKLTVIWAVLLAYYFVAMRRAPFAWRRAYLLVTALAGVVVPFLPPLYFGPMAENLTPVRQTITAVLDLRANATTTSPATGGQHIPWLLVVLVASHIALWYRVITDGIKIRRYQVDGQRSIYDGYPVITHPNIPSPMASFGVILLPAKLVGTPLHHTALLHETSHLRHRHHYDVVLLQCLLSLLWFHPLLWLLRHELNAVHEYQADADVVATIPRKTYGLQLIQASQTRAQLGLFSSPLKNRITMLTQPQSPSRNYLTPLLAVLLAGGLSLAFSDVYIPPPAPLTTEAQTTEFTPRLATLDKSATEQEARKALLQLLYTNIGYPAANRNNGMEGKSSLSLVIGTDGKVQSFATGADNQPKVYQEDGLGDIELVIIGNPGEPLDTEEANIEFFTEEAKKMLEVINEVGFLPPFMYGFNEPIEYRIYFKFQLEE